MSVKLEMEFKDNKIMLILTDTTTMDKITFTPTVAQLDTIIPALERARFDMQRRKLIIP